MKFFNIPVLQNVTCIKKFSTTCLKPKFYYERPMTRKLFSYKQLLNKRKEQTEYQWFRQWADEEELDLEVPTEIKYREFWEIGQKGRSKALIKWTLENTLKNVKYFPKKYYNLGGRLHHELEKEIIFPDYCDIVIIGGGLTGTSIAYHMKRIVGDALHVAIVDKDFTFSESASVHLPGIVKQQFSTEENFMLSQYAMQFLDNIMEEMSLNGVVPKINLNYSGYLTLASKEDGDELYKNYTLQRNLGVSVKFMKPDSLKRAFPWMNTEGIGHGVLGIGEEGWYDPWSLLAAMHRKLTSFTRTDYVHGEVIDCKAHIFPQKGMARGHPGDYSEITDIVVKLKDGSHRKIECSRCILAAGWRSGELSKIFDIGMGYDVYEAPLPISKRKRYLYYLYVEDGPGLNCPIVVDTSRIYFKREGLADLYLCGFSRLPTEDPLADNLETDDEYFRSEILPLLEQRCAAFKNCKIMKSKAVFHDYNEFDQNPVYSRHPGAINLFIATGFGENYVNALGAGNFYMEDLMNRKLSVDLGRYHFLRLNKEEKYIDSAIKYLN